MLHFSAIDPKDPKPATYTIRENKQAGYALKLRSDGQGIDYIRIDGITHKVEYVTQKKAFGKRLAIPDFLNQKEFLQALEKMKTSFVAESESKKAEKGTGK